MCAYAIANGTANATWELSSLGLFGASSIYGRSVVVLDSIGNIMSCATITPPGPTITFAAQIANGLEGWVYFEQDASLPTALTTIRVNLDWKLNQAFTSSLYWAVTTTCSASTVFDPFQEPTCVAPYFCAVGDLSGKHGNVRVNKTLATTVFNDVRLPLTGDFSIAGQYLLMQSALSGQVWCGQIKPVPQRAATLTINGSSVLARQTVPWAPVEIAVDLALVNMSVTAVPILLSSPGEAVCDLAEMYGPFFPNACRGACRTWDQFYVRLHLCFIFFPVILLCA